MPFLNLPWDLSLSLSPWKLKECMQQKAGWVWKYIYNFCFLFILRPPSGLLQRHQRQTAEAPCWLTAPEPIMATFHKPSHLVTLCLETEMHWKHQMCTFSNMPIVWGPWSIAWILGALKLEKYFCFLRLQKQHMHIFFQMIPSIWFLICSCIVVVSHPVWIAK